MIGMWCHRQDEHRRRVGVVVARLSRNPIGQTEGQSFEAATWHSFFFTLNNNTSLQVKPNYWNYWSTSPSGAPKVQHHAVVGPTCSAQPSLLPAPPPPVSCPCNDTASTAVPSNLHAHRVHHPPVQPNPLSNKRHSHTLKRPLLFLQYLLQRLRLTILVSKHSRA